MVSISGKAIPGEWGDTGELLEVGPDVLHLGVGPGRIVLSVSRMGFLPSPIPPPLWCTKLVVHFTVRRNSPLVFSNSLPSCTFCTHCNTVHIARTWRCRTALLAGCVTLGSRSLRTGSCPKMAIFLLKEKHPTAPR